MMRYCVLCLVISAAVVTCDVDPGRKNPPTKGAVWPKPQQEKKENTFYTYNPSLFEIKMTNHNCSILAKAIHRYKNILISLYSIPERFQIQILKEENNSHLGHLQELQVELTAPCEIYPHLEMVERYQLNVAAISKIESSSIWGILRGLETFAQLFYLADSYPVMRINTTQILDYPRYPHRGLLLDTARHFISVPNILKTLDAMTMNKMNVLHWHIVDDQSFPYQSENFPELSARGAYHPSMTYTKADIQNIINYARHRGIRVLPEFDVPGHTRAWGEGYPNLLTQCFDRHGQVTSLGPMNPMSNYTYSFLQDLFQELHERFPEKHLHVGGDEVAYDCWNSNPDLDKFMKENSISSVKQLHAYFMRNTIPLLARTGSIPIVWQEVFDEGVSLSSETIVQVWKGSWGGRSPEAEMIQILNAGHKVLFSEAWYLDHLDKNFQKYYQADPREMVRCYNEGFQNLRSSIENIIGGEACMWTEKVDDRNLFSRVWPRASAVAEKLWSAPSEGVMRNMPDEVYYRIEEHACRMLRRGVPSEPGLGPGFCIN